MLQGGREWDVLLRQDVLQAAHLVERGEGVEFRGQGEEGGARGEV